MTNQCILCSPDPAHLVLETEHSKVVYFPHAIKPGHLIVGIKSHIRKIEEVPLHELLATTKLLQRVAQATKRLLGNERFYVAVVGDRDLHFHFHLLPKNEPEPMLGMHLFSPSGWSGALGYSTPVAPDAKFIAQLKERLE